MMEAVKGLEKALIGQKTLSFSVRVAKEGKDIEVLNQYTDRKETVKLNLYQRIALVLGIGRVKESVRRYEGWSGSIPFYVFKYRINGETFLMLDYPHGYDRRFRTDFKG